MYLTQQDVRSQLTDLMKSGATELHLKVPNRPQLRVGRDLVPTQEAPLKPENVMRFATLLCGLANVEIPLATVTHHEFSFGVNGLGRFHTILYRQRSTLAIQLRTLTFGAPSLPELGVDANVDSVFGEAGLYLICGDRTRSDLLASLVATYNATRRGLVVVVEDPVLILHHDDRATIAQRGVGTDVPSLAMGVLGAIRQHADMICVGDIPDRETAESTLRAAESGALVFAAVPAPGAQLAASWLLRHYTSDRDMDATNRIKRLLRGVFHIERGQPGEYIARRRSVQTQAA